MITDSAFIRNKNIDFDCAGGALSIFGNKNQPNNHFDVRIRRVLYEENIAQAGVISMSDVEVLITDCTLLNNFASSYFGAQINSVGLSSVNLSLFHSVFKQTIPKITINVSRTFMATSFLRLFNVDTLIIINTTFDQQTILDNAQIFLPIVKSLWIDNTSLSFCPLGHEIERIYYGYENRDQNRFLLLHYPVGNVTTTFTPFKEEQQEV